MLPQMNEYIQRMKRNKSPITIKGYKCSIGKYEKFLNGREMSSETVDEFIQYLLDVEKAKRVSIHRHVWAIKSFFNFLGRGDELKNVASMLPKPEATEQRMAMKEEIITLLNSEYTTQTEHLMIRLLYNLALRVGELVVIKREDFKTDANKVYYADTDKWYDVLEITSEKKRSGSRTDPMALEDETIVKELKEYIGSVKGEYIFSYDDGKTHITTETVRNRIKNLCRIEGIRDLNPHSFRHARATELKKTIGVEDKFLMDFLRHNTMTATKKYTHTKTMDLVGKIPKSGL